MGLPPRPKGRPLVRRAVVASMLVSGACDQGAKPAPAPEQKQQVPHDAPLPMPVPPQVAPPDPLEPIPVPPQVAHAPPPQVAHAPPPQVAHATPPQVAYANGFTVLLVDDADKPLAKKQVKVTLDTGETLTATTSDRGTAYFSHRVSHAITVSIAVRGYRTLDDAQIDGDMHPFERFVMRKR